MLRTARFSVDCKFIYVTNEYRRLFTLDSVIRDWNGKKFAVDLDKVLDDFELNEDRAERFAAKNKTPPKQQPLLGRVNARSTSKWESYSRPELPE
ncbi:hypothetical protein J437_LFUL011858, partial [Ladona fulva]